MCSGDGATQRTPSPGGVPGTGASAISRRGQTDDVLVVLGSGDADYRGYALRALATERRVVLIDHSPMTWQRDVVDTIVDADPRRPHAVLDALRETGIAPAGLVTYDEFSVQSAAATAAALGLRFASPEAARRCRDKSDATGAARLRRALGTQRGRIRPGCCAGRCGRHRLPGRGQAGVVGRKHRCHPGRPPSAARGAV